MKHINRDPSANLLKKTLYAFAKRPSIDAVWDPGTDGHMLELDPPGGPAVLTDYAEAWGISEPPWVFIIDRDGRLQAKFTGVIGSDELRAAITSITPWHPVGSA